MSEQKLKICVLAEANGDHTFVQCEVLKNFGHEVTLISPNKGRCPEGVKHIECHVENANGIFGKLRWLFRIYQGVKSAQADVYHAHYAAELTTWMAWILRKKPFVISCLGGDVLFDEQGSQSFIRRWFTKRALKKCDYVTVVSHFLGKVVQAMGISSQKIQRVIWGVNTKKFYEIDDDGSFRKQWKIDQDAPLIFSPRQFKPFYNQGLMIRAFADVLIKMPNAVLTLSTYNQDDEFRTEMESLVDELEVRENIRFLPGLNPQEMMLAYNASDMVLSLPPSDGTPVSVMEAMVCGTPVVMTNLERFKEFFAHKESALFTPLEQKDIVHNICDLLSNNDLYECIRTEGKKIIVENADLHSQTRILEEIFYRLLNQGKRTS